MNFCRHACLPVEMSSELAIRPIYCRIYVRIRGVDLRSTAGVESRTGLACALLPPRSWAGHTRNRVICASRIRIHRKFRLRCLPYFCEEKVAPCSIDQGFFRGTLFAGHFYARKASLRHQEIGDERLETRCPNCPSPCVFRPKWTELVPRVAGRNAFAWAGFAVSKGTAGSHR